MLHNRISITHLLGTCFRTTLKLDDLPPLGAQSFENHCTINSTTFLKVLFLSRLLWHAIH
jgi:hypothetical protein